MAFPRILQKLFAADGAGPLLREDILPHRVFTVNQDQFDELLTNNDQVPNSWYIIDNTTENGGGGGSLIAFIQEDGTPLFTGKFTLPVASASILGGVKVGTGLNINDGVLNNSNPTPSTPYSLPTASASVKGGVKVGSGLAMSGEVLYSTLSSSPILSIQVVTSNASNVILYAPSGGTWHCIGVPVSASNAANGLYNVRLTTNVAGGSVVISSATGATALCFRVA